MKKVLILAVFYGFMVCYELRHPDTRKGPIVGSLTTAQTVYVDEPDHKLLTDADLNAMFDALNVQYFGGKLPKIAVTFAPMNSLLEAYYNNSSAIFISTRERDQYNPLDCRNVLLHEMAHHYVRTVYPNSEENGNFKFGHGQLWKAEMRHLASLGAFDNKLWTPYDLP